MVGTRLALALVLMATPALLAGQTVRGQLTDSITKTPLPGAFLTLVDEHGVERARTITNSAGEFLLTAPTPGTYRLRSKRIGFRPYVSTTLALRAGETSAFNAAVDPIPVALSEIVVEGERQCDIESGGGASVAALWDEVREALAAVSWTSRVPSYWYQLTDFRRELTTSGRHRGQDSTWLQEGYAINPIRNFVTEAEFQREGYVLETDTGIVYRAPDADVLLSGTFLRTHCFDVERGKGDNEGLYGLAFTSARDRSVPDITGTLWIDRTTSELRRLQFHYIRLPQDVTAPNAGGVIEFMRLPSGVWIVRDWALRMPLTRLIQRAMAMGTQPEVTGYIEAGGSISAIKTVSGTAVYGTPTVALAGGAGPATPLPPAPPPVSDEGSPPPAPPPSDCSMMRAAGDARKSHNQNLIADIDVACSSAIDAYGLIQELRPMWLRSRGEISIHNPGSGNVQVYINGDRFGDVNRLREIAKRDIREVHFYNPGQAEMKFGAGNAGGVIDVATGVITPQIATNPNPPPPEPPAAPPPPPPPPASAAPPVPPSDPAADSAAARTAEAIADSLMRVPRANRRRLAYNQNVLTPEEFAGTSPTDVFMLIQHFRPNWLLRNRGPVSIYDRTAGDVRVYLNGVATGDLSRLHDFRSEDVRELRFLSAGEAQQRYGTGNAGGAIEVWTK